MTPPNQSLWKRSASAAFATATAVISSLWIAICAAAPEFIWRGSQIAVGHLGRAELLSALLIGLVLAFFIEPAMERVRHLLPQGEHGERTERKPRNALFTASMSLAFAFASVCLHEAMTAFVSGDDDGHGGPPSGLDEGIRLTASWAIVPFFITSAWLSAGQRWVRIATGLVAAGSSLIAGWIFSWSMIETITTAIPCVLIQFLGYRQMFSEPRQYAFARCARSIVLVAPIWLVTSLLVDMVFDFYALNHFQLYNWEGFWVDARFYLGWALGLALAPFPYRSARNGSAVAT